jgi:hypothetical protein
VASSALSEADCVLACAFSARSLQTQFSTLEIDNLSFLRHLWHKAGRFLFFYNGTRANARLPSRRASWSWRIFLCSQVVAQLESTRFFSGNKKKEFPSKARARKKKEEKIEEKRRIMLKSPL